MSMSMSNSLAHFHVHGHVHVCVHVHVHVYVHVRLMLNESDVRYRIPKKSISNMMLDSAILSPLSLITDIGLGPPMLISNILMYMYVCILYMYRCVFIHICSVCMYVCIYIHIYIYIYIGGHG